MSDSDVVEVELSQREVNLLLEYAYPFDDEREQLEKFKDSPGLHVLRVDTFYLSRLIGDLVYSAKGIEDEELLEEFDTICITMENAEQGKSRKPFVV